MFSDPGKREALNAITHPKVGQRFAEKLAKWRDTDKIVGATVSVPLPVVKITGFWAETDCPLLP